MRRVAALCSALVVVLSGLIAVGLSSSPAHAAPPITPSPTTPMVGERYTVSGVLKTAVARPVRLELKVGKKWKKIATGRTDKTGRFTLGSSATKASVVVRVVASKVKIKHKKYAQIVTKTRTIRTTAANQSANLTIDTSVKVGASVSAVLKFAPARLGRPVQLELWDGSAWQPVQRLTQTADGTATAASLTPVKPGTFSYRAAAPSWNGVAAVASAPVQVTVTPNQVEVSKDFRPITPDEVGTAVAYDPKAGEIAFNGAPASLSGLAAGQIITVPPMKGAPSGLLAKVTGVTRDGSQTVVETEPAPLASVIKDIPEASRTVGMTVLSSKFTPGDGVEVMTSPQRAKVSPQGGLRPTSYEALKLKVGLSGEYSGNTLSADGEVSISPAIDLDFDVSGFQLHGYRIGSGVEVANTLSTSAKFSVSDSVEVTLGELRQVLVGAVGPVPIWVESDLKLVARFTETGAVTVTAELSQSGVAKSGIMNTSRDNLTPTPYMSAAAVTAALRKVEASGEMELFLGPEVDIMLYSLAGPYASAGAKGTMNLTIPMGSSEPPSCELSFGATAEVGVKTSDGLKALTGVQFKGSFSGDFATMKVQVCPGPGDSDSGGSGAVQPLTVLSGELPDGKDGQAYAGTLNASGGSGSYHWSASGLPSWLHLDGNTGALSGTADKGEYSFEATVTDSKGASRSKTVTLSVAAAYELTVGASANFRSTCAVTETGEVWCWGNNDAGQLGYSPTQIFENFSTTPQRIGGIDNAIAVATGQQHACAVLTSGTVKCWGAHWYGQLGDGSVGTGTGDYSTSPVTVSGLSDVVAIAAGYQHTCALTKDHQVWCWGWNPHGSTGSQNESDPTPHQAMDGAIAIAVTDFTSCAVTTDHKASCWGDLPDGSPESADPQQNPRITDAISIGVDTGQACVLTKVGTVRCWGIGDDDNNELTSPEDPLAPIVIAHLSGARSISMNGGGGCAATNTGAVKCWGALTTDPGGLAFSGHSAVEIDVPGTTAAVAAGIGHTCAISTSGRLTCWGINEEGQLGNGSTTDSGTPATVVGLG